MHNKNIAIVETYYTAMNNKDLDTMAQYLHHNIKLTSPLSTVHGKEAVLQAAHQFFSAFESITLHEKFGHDNQVMVVININFPNQTEPMRSAALISIKDNLIVSNELFHDTQFMNNIKTKLQA